MNINKYAVVRKFICWIIKKKKYEELYERTVLNVLNNVNECFSWCHIRHLFGYFNDSHIITENVTKTCWLC